MKTSSKQWKMGTYMPSRHEYAASKWCMNNNITIYPVADISGKWYIEINISGKKNKSPSLYGKDIIWKQLHEYYAYYYDKYKK